MSRLPPKDANQRQARACGDKHRHATQKDAERERKRCRQPTLGVYRCEFCGFYHVGHKPGSRVDRLAGERVRRRRRELDEEEVLWA